MNLNQVTIPSQDVARSSAFYQTLGMRLIVDALPRYVRLELPQGDATFSIHRVEEAPVSPGVLIYFESDRLDSWVKELQGLGIVFEQLPRDERWLWREARLKDPDGNQLVLYYAGKNRKDPPWKI